MFCPSCVVRASDEGYPGLLTALMILTVISVIAVISIAPLVVSMRPSTLRLAITVLGPLNEERQVHLLSLSAVPGATLSVIFFVADAETSSYKVFVDAVSIGDMILFETKP